MNTPATRRAGYTSAASPMSNAPRSSVNSLSLASAMPSSAMSGWGWSFLPASASISPCARGYSLPTLRLTRYGPSCPGASRAVFIGFRCASVWSEDHNTSSIYYLFCNGFGGVGSVAFRIGYTRHMHSAWSSLRCQDQSISWSKPAFISWRYWGCDCSC